MMNVKISRRRFETGLIVPVRTIALKMRQSAGFQKLNALVFTLLIHLLVVVWVFAILLAVLLVDDVGRQSQLLRNLINIVVWITG